METAIPMTSRRIGCWEVPITRRPLSFADFASRYDAVSGSLWISLDGMLKGPVDYQIRNAPLPFRRDDACDLPLSKDPHVTT